MPYYTEAIGIIAGIIAFLNIVPYTISIFKKETKPSRSAYAIWLGINIVTATSYISVGATSTFWVFLAFAFTNLVVFILSIKYGMGGLRKLDLVCVGIGILAITLWIATDNPAIALYASLIAKLIGYIPIIHKSYRHPNTENTLAWNMSATASLLNVAALGSLQPEIAIAPLALATMDIAVATLLNTPRKVSQHVRQTLI